ncbi:unnamed protein product, partial [marine sediment metagenome]
QLFTKSHTIFFPHLPTPERGLPVGGTPRG